MVLVSPHGHAGADGEQCHSPGVTEPGPGLRIVDQHPATTAVLGPVEEAEAYLWPPTESPPEDGETLMDLLHRELGAYLISG